MHLMVWLTDFMRCPHKIMLRFMYGVDLELFNVVFSCSDFVRQEHTDPASVLLTYILWFTDFDF